MTTTPNRQAELARKRERCRLAHHVDDQRQWIARHGGDILGYMRLLGPRGLAIYQHDIGELARLEALLADDRRRK